MFQQQNIQIINRRIKTFQYFPQYQMFRSIPVSNKICFDKDLKRKWRIHQQKLRRLKGSVGKQKPQEFVFLDQRLKKSALQQIKNIEIERENTILLNKMKEISDKGAKNSYLTSSRQQERNNKKKTLNEPYRKKELVKIVGENQDILKRIHEKKSAYNIRKMERDRKQIEKNISLISQFPYKNYPSRNTPTNLWMTDDTPFKSSKSHVRIYALSYSGTRKINQFYYVISSFLKNGIFTIEIENLEKASQKYKMELEEQQVKKLLSTSYENKLQNLINSLQIDQNQESCYLKYQIKSAHH